MEAQSARQLPDPLDRVQIRAIGRQIAQCELGFLLHPPTGVEFSVMILRIIGNDDDTAPRPAAALTLAQKTPSGHSVKAMIFALKEKLSVPQTDRAEIADTLARGVVKHHRVVYFRRNPHAGAGTVLLEVNFINRPQVHARISCQGA